MHRSTLQIPENATNIISIVITIVIVAFILIFCAYKISTRDTRNKNRSNEWSDDIEIEFLGQDNQGDFYGIADRIVAV